MSLTMGVPSHNFSSAKEDSDASATCIENVYFVENANGNVYAVIGIENIPGPLVEQETLESAEPLRLQCHHCQEMLHYETYALFVQCGNCNTMNSVRHGHVVGGPVMIVVCGRCRTRNIAGYGSAYVECWLCHIVCEVNYPASTQRRRGSSYRSLREWVAARRLRRQRLSLSQPPASSQSPTSSLPLPTSQSPAPQPLPTSQPPSASHSTNLVERHTSGGTLVSASSSVHQHRGSVSAVARISRTVEASSSDAQGGLAPAAHVRRKRKLLFSKVPLMKFAVIRRRNRTAAASTTANTETVEIRDSNATSANHTDSTGTERYPRAPQDTEEFNATSPAIATSDTYIAEGSRITDIQNFPLPPPFANNDVYRTSE